jgi:hypothetical protein
MIILELVVVVTACYSYVEVEHNISLIVRTTALLSLLPRPNQFLGSYKQ